jgi:presequence protease
MIIDKRNPECIPGDMIRNFKVLRQKPIDDAGIIFHELEHIPTGAHLVHLSSKDDNNVFIVAVRTIPTDSTGVAHILEHSVLEGSKRFPVRAYRNLTGRSLNTFLNAMTSADYTAYPFASRNKKDFFNLMHVYLDAAFFPLLRKETFLQEGWRYEFDVPDDPETPLKYKGVVYNEMKGAIGNPLRQFYENLKQSLYPDLTYRHISGGDPAHIPDLSFEEWKAFHAYHYHPSNAYFVTYGNIPVKDTIEVLEDNVLKHFERIDPPPPTAMQSNYPEPQRKRFTFAVSEQDDTSGKAFVAILWKLLPQKAFYKNLQLSLLNLILAGDNSSILNRALLSSGLGGGLAPVRFDNSFPETHFGIGLKDTDEDKADAIEALILTTLRELVSTGIPREDIDAAVHQLEFFSREIRGDHGVPVGLHLAMQGMNEWMNQCDFSKSLSIGEYLDKLRSDTEDPEFIKQLIQTYLLDNPHRITMIMVPEKGGVEIQEKTIRSHLESIRAKLSEQDISDLLEQAGSLKKHQETEEDSSCIPKVTVADISPEPEDTPCNEETVDSSPLIMSPVPTNGITYMTLEFDEDFSSVKPTLPLAIMNVLTSLGAAGRDYVEMGRHIRQKVGSISYNISPYRNLKTGKLHLANILSSRCLPRNHAVMTEIAGDLLLKPDFSDLNRLAELISMKKAYALPTASYNGHRMAWLASARWISPVNHFLHQMDGLGFIQSLLKFNQEEMAGLAGTMTKLLADTISKKQLHIGGTGLADDLQDLKTHLITLLDRLPQTTSEQTSAAYSPDSVSPNREAWIINTDVSYVAKSIPVVSHEHPDAPVLRVISQLMELPLYSRIRAQGGAYGAFAKYNPELAVFSMMTYRDPHTAQSLDGFKTVVDELAAGQISDEKIDHAVIETIRILDIPPSPREKGFNAFFDRLRNRTFEMKKRHREGILNITRKDINRVLDTYFVQPMIHGIAIVTSDETLKNKETASLNLERISLLEN